ncbi:hypothetical protein SUGI_0972520 [Cryptomeria japonica]|nr:hypothetical protein SUGI_0972520 [Cryptomeria japonica]
MFVAAYFMLKSCVSGIIFMGSQGFVRFSTRENAHLQRLQGPSKQSPDGCLKQMETQKRLAEIRSTENRVAVACKGFAWHFAEEKACPLQVLTEKRKTFFWVISKRIKEDDKHFSISIL